jgi:lactoylglutathione lyase
VIRSLFKTYLLVRDMDRAVEFYRRLGLRLAYRYADGSRAFLWVDAASTQCIALRLVDERRPFARRHVAFGVALSDLQRAEAWLAERTLHPIADWGLDPIEPIVNNWVPAAALSFEDPDGNHVELSAPLDGPPIPGLAETLYLSDWERCRSGG